ncbi:MAG: TrkA family potassium uptake protein [bacterium]
MYIIIIGCGRVGSQLATIMSKEGHDVVVIDKNSSSFSRLGSTFNGITLNGSGFDRQLLENAGITKAGAFAALTNGDNANIMCAQIAKNIYKVKKVICRVYDPSRAQTYEKLGLDIISGTLLIAKLVREKLLERDETITVDRMSPVLESLEFIEYPAQDNIIGKKIEDINIVGNFLIYTIRKGNKELIPAPDTIIKKDDIILAIKIKNSKKEKSYHAEK